MDRYYLAVNGKKQGPYPTAQLREFAHRGTLGPHDMVLKEGWTRWVGAGSVDGLFGNESNGPTDDPVECKISVNPPVTAFTQGTSVGNEDWYYSKNGQSFGPFTFPHLAQLASAGLLLPNDMVLSDGARERGWLPAHSVPCLLPGRVETKTAVKPTSDASSPLKMPIF
jgi:hypothetical protein